MSTEVKQVHLTVVFMTYARMNVNVHDDRKHSTINIGQTEDLGIRLGHKCIPEKVQARVKGRQERESVVEFVDSIGYDVVVFGLDIDGNLLRGGRSATISEGFAQVGLDEAEHDFFGLVGTGHPPNELLTVLLRVRLCLARRARPNVGRDRLPWAVGELLKRNQKSLMLFGGPHPRDRGLDVRLGLALGGRSVRVEVLHYPLTRK